MSILNPEAVGDPDQTPIVHLSPAMARLMGRCEAPAASQKDGQCGGVNGHHQDDCQRLSAADIGAACRAMDAAGIAPNASAQAVAAVALVLRHMATVR